MSDLRKDVSEPVHAVLDLLDRGRVGWERLSDAELRSEILLEGSAVQPSVRKIALMLFAFERV